MVYVWPSKEVGIHLTMSKRLELLNQIEVLEKETGITLAVQDPKKYRQNNKKIDRLRKKLLKMCSS
jgi:hypothetical protein